MDDRRFAPYLYPNCTDEILYENVEKHKNICQFGPNAIITCLYCEGEYRKQTEKSHRSNCIFYIKFENIELSRNLERSEQEKAALQAELQTAKTEILKLKSV